MSKFSSDERVSVATQALWDIRRLLGFDNDGDPTPAAAIAGMGLEGFVNSVLDDVKRHVAEMAD